VEDKMVVKSTISIFFISLLLSFNSGCSIDIEDGVFECTPAETNSCPDGYSCIKQGTNTEHFCYSSNTGECGDGVLHEDQGEQCDNNLFKDNFSCESGLTPLCTSNCQAYCPVCGDYGMETEITDGISTGESCDGTDFKGKTCAAPFNLGQGNLLCTPNCQIDFSNCSILKDTNISPTFTDMPDSVDTKIFRNGKYLPDATDIENNTLTWEIYRDECSFDVIIGRTTGEASWSCLGPEQCNVIIKVTDNGIPNLYDLGTLTVSCVNTKPAITTSPQLQAMENTEYRYNIACNDPENNEVSLDVVIGDTCGGYILDNGDGTGTYIFTPHETQGGTNCMMRIECSDSNTTDLQYFTLQIYETNSAPFITNLPGDKSSHWSSPGNFSVMVNDNDFPTNSMVFNITDNNCSFNPTIDSDSGAINWICTQVETCTIDVTATDNGTPPLFDSQELTVHCTNTSPETSTQPLNDGKEDIPYSFIFSCSDIDDDPLFFQIGPNDNCPNSTITTIDGTSVLYEFIWNDIPEDSNCDIQLICSDTNSDATMLYTLTTSVSPWNQLAPGTIHSCGLREGHLYCWGNGLTGALGTGDYTDHNTKTEVAGNNNDWTYISTGKSVSCAIRSGGLLYCWGSNGSGQLGDGTISRQNIPTAVDSTITDWVNVSTMSLHTCGLTNSGKIYCWGRNSEGQLATGDILEKHSPSLIDSLFSDWTSAQAGEHFSCGIRGTGSLYCWGKNDLGQLGINSTESTSSPIEVHNSWSDWSQVSPGKSHTCAIRNGRGYCWGDNSVGQLGNNSTTPSTTPVEIDGAHTDWEILSAGDSFTCGLRTNGNLYCWGNNIEGQFGIGTSGTQAQTPQQIDFNAGEWVFVKTSQNSSVMGISQSGNKPFAWGYNMNLQLGVYQSSGNILTPQRVYDD
jgi:alpha-tubulin suppressor-like RCC1 family protein